MGVDVGELPSTEQEAIRMLYILTANLPPPNDESIQLVMGHNFARKDLNHF